LARLFLLTIQLRDLTFLRSTKGEKSMSISINHIQSTDYYSVWEAKVDESNYFRFTTQLRTLPNVGEFKGLRAGSKDFGDVTLYFENEEVEARLGFWYFDAIPLSKKLTWYKLGEFGICDFNLTALEIAIEAEKELMDAIENYRKRMSNISEEKEVGSYEDHIYWKEIEGCPVRFTSGYLE